MLTPILVVATASRWYGAARMPRAFANAGFQVVLLAPRGSLAEKSRFVAKVGLLDDPTTPLQWLYAFAAIVKATSPRLVVPADDMAYQLLQELALSPPAQLKPELELALGGLIRDSLGDPAHYRTSVDNTLLPPAAEAAGVRVPPYAVVERLDEAEAFAANSGYPIVLKRRHSSAGSGVAICPGGAELAQAMQRFSTSTLQDFGPDNDGRMIVQVHIAGRTKFYPTMAWHGKLLAGYAGEKLESAAGPTSPPTVNRYFRSQDLRAVSEKLAAAFGMTGFYSPEFIEDERTGVAYLMEINRRLVGGAHRGGAIGVDHSAALYAALHGLASTTRADLDEGEEHFTVHFPQEWLRDPTSTWLRNYPVDIPWDDPALFEAMLALRHAP